MTTLNLAIDGMHCDGCVKRVAGALQKAGATVEAAAVGSARVLFDEGKAKPEDFVAALKQNGFEARVAGGSDGR